MPKLKTKSACKKRFKLTGTGKLKRFGTAGHNHFMRNKSKRHNKAAVKSQIVRDENATTIKKWMPFASKFRK